MFEAPLIPGSHTLEMVGFEGCCDGWQTLNVALPAACSGTPGENCGILDNAALDWLLVDSTGTTDYTCTASAPAMVNGQIISFGCVDHEAVSPCTYSANANPNDFTGALNAFAECRIASQAAQAECDPNGTGACIRGCVIQTDKAQGLSMQDACNGPSTNVK